MYVGHKSRRRWADDDACNEVADQRRHLNPFSNETKDQSNAETGGNGGDQRNVVIHPVPFVGPPDIGTKVNCIFLGRYNSPV